MRQSARGGPVGGSTFLVDAMPRDNATTFGKLQKQIFYMLGHEERLTAEESRMLQEVYRYYQRGGKFNKRMAMKVVGLWREKFKGCNEKKWESSK